MTINSITTEMLTKSEPPPMEPLELAHLIKTMKSTPEVLRTVGQYLRISQQLPLEAVLGACLSHGVMWGINLAEQNKEGG